ncbi:MAG: AAA family ATPase [Promethearchaeota archaeon]|jgi:hypothetical protein
MIEHERSYVFTHEGAYKFLEGQGFGFYYDPNDPDPSVKFIEDYYLGRGIRVRKSWSQSEASPPGVTYISANGVDIGKSSETGSNGLPPKTPSYVFTRKTGDKSKGYRFEFEEKISQKLAEQLTADAKLCVKKTRKKLPVADEAYVVTMDFIEEPMRIAVLEIEACSEVVYPIPFDITMKLFKTELLECPLCSFTMFNRHIAICGGPSAGKSEMAKILSYTINTEYRGNSFHVAEFATTFIQKYRKNPNFWEEFFIWHGQHEREHSADMANIVISDCPTFLTYIYLLHLPKDAFSEDTALVLAKMYKRVLFDINWYSDIIFLQLNEYRENQVRYQSETEALKIESRICGFLDDHNITYSTYNYNQRDEILKKLFYINV